MLARAPGPQGSLLLMRGPSQIPGLGGQSDDRIRTCWIPSRTSIESIRHRAGFSAIQTTLSIALAMPWLLPWAPDVFNTESDPRADRHRGAGRLPND